MGMSMIKLHFGQSGLAVLLSLGLAGCIPEDSNESDSTSAEQCESSTTTTVVYYTVPEITYTEVDETTDANDASVDAQSIALNTIVTGDMSYPSMGGCVDCDDYYSVAVQPGDEVEVIIAGEAGTNFDLYLYDGSGFNVYSNGGDPVEKVNYTIPTGMTELIILANAYDGTGDYTLTVTQPAEPVAVTNVQEDECLGDLSGYISSATDDSRLANATINLREGGDVETGEISVTASTGSDGTYSFSNVEAGEYTAEIIFAGYSTVYQNLTIVGNSTMIQNFALSPTLAAGEVRIVLTWGEAPRDLDSYLQGPKATSGEYTISFRNKTEENTSLDRDDTSSFGPETITISSQNSGAYSYWVKPYSGTSSSLANSSAIVSIYDENGLAEQIKVPSGTGYKWNVFTMSSGVITVVNTIVD
jgi:uncharacterized protein YfaP (DUF2135 family)